MRIIAVPPSLSPFPLVAAPLLAIRDQVVGFVGAVHCRYEPFIILGAMLCVPILTVSVLKGCWMMVDFFVPPAGAPVPNNYAQRKLMQEVSPGIPAEVEVCTQ